MGSLIAYLGSDPERLRAALLPHRELLRVTAAPAADADALASCGLGFYQGGEVLLQRRPRLLAAGEASAPGSLVDLYEMAKDLRTDVLLGQVRVHAATRLAKNENTPPFRFRSWLLAHQGQIAGEGRGERPAEELLRTLPDFLRRNVRGQTDSELFLHLFLSALHEGGSSLIEDANLPPEAALRALHKTLARLAEGAKRPGAALGPQQVVLSNGRMLLVLRHGEGLAPLGFLRLGAVNDGGRVHEHFRGVLVTTLRAAAPEPQAGQAPASEPQVPEELPINHALLVGRDLNPRVVAAG